MTPLYHCRLSLILFGGALCGLGGCGVAVSSPGDSPPLALPPTTAIEGESESSAAENPAAETPRDETPTPERATAPPPARRQRGSKQISEKTFDDIKLDLEKDEPFDRSLITPEIEKLSGERIRIRGYMLPTAQRSGLAKFVLVRDNQECCFGPGAALHDCIIVEMQQGRTAEFSIRPVAVEGTFRIEEWTGPTGQVWAIYHLLGESVQ